MSSFPYYSSSPTVLADTVSNFFVFKVVDCDAVLGYVPDDIATRLPLTSIWRRDDSRRMLVLDIPAADEAAFKKRNQCLAAYLEDVRSQKLFRVLDGWRNELYPIYGPGRELLLDMERSATPLFGVVSYGVHMTGYTYRNQELMVWTPHRAPTKQTYPGMMDNTVAGGLGTGEQPFACLVREAQEEASLPEQIVRNAKACGTVTYFHIRDARAGGETDLCQPECQYVYDLEIPEDVTPKPEDGEAVDFRLLTIGQLQEALTAGELKPNCALVLLDFFVRHGIIKAENEPDYIEIVARLHRTLDFPVA